MQLVLLARRLGQHDGPAGADGLVHDPHRGLFQPALEVKIMLDALALFSPKSLADDATQRITLHNLDGEFRMVFANVAPDLRSEGLQRNLLPRSTHLHFTLVAIGLENQIDDASLIVLLQPRTHLWAHVLVVSAEIDSRVQHSPAAYLHLVLQIESLPIVEDLDFAAVEYLWDGWVGCGVGDGEERFLQRARALDGVVEDFADALGEQQSPEIVDLKEDT